MKKVFLSFLFIFFLASCNNKSLVFETSSVAAHLSNPMDGILDFEIRSDTVFVQKIDNTNSVYISFHEAGNYGNSNVFGERVDFFIYNEDTLEYYIPADAVIMYKLKDGTILEDTLNWATPITLSKITPNSIQYTSYAASLFNPGYVDIVEDSLKNNTSSFEKGMMVNFTLPLKKYPYEKLFGGVIKMRLAIKPHYIDIDYPDNEFSIQLQNVINAVEQKWKEVIPSSEDIHSNF